MVVPDSWCLWPVEVRRRPVLELHPQRQAARSQHFLDLVQRLAAEIRSLQELGLGALDEIADVIDVLGLKAIGRADRELQIVDGPQQDRIDLRHRALVDRRLGALEAGDTTTQLDTNAVRV